MPLISELSQDGEKKNFCLVKNISKLLSIQVSKHNGLKEFFLRCLNHFSDKNNLANKEVKD